MVGYIFVLKILCLGWNALLERLWSEIARDGNSPPKLQQMARWWPQRLLVREPTKGRHVILESFVKKNFGAIHNQSALATGTALCFFGL